MVWSLAALDFLVWILGASSQTRLFPQTGSKVSFFWKAAFSTLVSAGEFAAPLPSSEVPTMRVNRLATRAGFGFMIVSFDSLASTAEILVKRLSAINRQGESAPPRPS